MFYNSGQEYRRGRVSERGDRCEFFGFENRLLVEALEPYEQKVENHAERPFHLTHAPTDSSSYLLQRLVVEHLLTNETPDHLLVEESLVRVLGLTLRYAYQRCPRNLASKPAQREVVDNLKTLLAARFHEQLTLDVIAAELHYSPFHLCRIFQQETGLSIHRYLGQLRLRTALEWISGGAPLNDLAIVISRRHFARSSDRRPPASARYQADGTQLI
jgi:AraC-like DNA-binding protein